MSSSLWKTARERLFWGHGHVERDDDDEDED